MEISVFWQCFLLYSKTVFIYTAFSLSLLNILKVVCCRFVVCGIRSKSCTSGNMVKTFNLNRDLNIITFAKICFLIAMKGWMHGSNGFPFLALRIVWLVLRLTNWCQDKWINNSTGNVPRKHRDMSEGVLNKM